MAFTSINPTNEKIIRHYDEMSPKKVRDIASLTHQAFLEWRDQPMTVRSQILARVAEHLEKNKTSHATLMTHEMGKPIGQALSEIEKCASACRYFAEKAPEYLRDHIIPTEAQKSYVTFKPLGVILGIMPWNFPFWQVFRFVAPTLMAGNTILIKHAPNVTGCALTLENILQDIKAPPHLLRVLVTRNETIDDLIEDPLIAAVTLTGSPRAGRAVAQRAGAALKKSVMELGGSDPYIILEDADLEKASETCLHFRLSNAGQVCISPKRLIIVDPVYDRFEKLVLEKTVAKKMGDPLDPHVDIGPMARKDLRHTLHEQVEKCRKMGAKVLVGGKIPKGPGWFYPPTLLTHITPKMPAYHEELFGPVIVLIRAKNEEEALRIANDTPYGLGAGVFTQNLERGEGIARDKLEAGNCTVNTIVKSDPRLPFGGIKGSGYGRELASFGIHEFVNVKTVIVE